MRKILIRRTVKNRIILTILLLIVVPSMIAFFSSLSIYSTRTNATAIDAKKQVLIQINKNINVNLNKYSKLTMQLYYNTELVSAIGSREKTAPQRSLIREYLNSCVNSDANLTSAYVTMQNETILTDKSFQAIDTFFNAYQEKVESSKGKMVWIPTQRFVSSYGNKEDAFVAARSIRKDNRQIGIIWLFINERFFNSLYDEGALSDGSTSVIISSDGAIINVTGDGALPDSFADIVTKRQGSKVVDIGGTRQLVVYSASSENDWVYINITPEATILMGVRDIQSIILVIITLYYRRKGSGNLAAFGIDTWGVDYGLLDKDGDLLGNPRAYRGAVDSDMQKVWDVVSKQELFSRTGIAAMNFNTVYQLYRRKLENDEELKKAQTLLLMPDLLGYLFTGGCALHI